MTERRRGKLVKRGRNPRRTNEKTKQKKAATETHQNTKLPKEKKNQQKTSEGKEESAKKPLTQG